MGRRVSDSKVHGANTGPTWVLLAPGGPHIGPMNLATWGGKVEQCDLSHCMCYPIFAMLMIGVEMLKFHFLEYQKKTQDSMSHWEWFLVVKWGLFESIHNLSNFKEIVVVVTIVPADILAPLGGRISAGTVMTKLGTYIDCIWSIGFIFVWASADMIIHTCMRNDKIKISRNISAMGTYLYRRFYWW